MLIMRKLAYAAAAIIGAAALTATLTTSARANSWDYGYGYGNTSPQAHGAAVLDLETTWFDCIDLTTVSDTREPDGTYYAVEKGFCGAPK
jgi:hypothetical protein